LGKLAGKTIEAFARGNFASVEEVGSSLRNLRKFSGLTQVEVAKRLNIQQAAVSKIENCDDVHLSTVKKYVEALGASLKIDATFPADAALTLQVRETFDIECGSDDQLVLPILGDDKFPPHRDVVLSIRPRYSEKIISGDKTVELRRRFPVSAPKGTIAYIYSTSPVRAMVGSAQIKSVLKLPVEEIWDRFSQKAFIQKPDFDNYFEGSEVGFALLFEKVKPFSEPLPLELLRKQFDFEPPQSFLYAKHDLRNALKQKATVVSH
jgi:predicted transcriptional regulator/DNA-binding XRE family transcriptional regulator